MGARAGDIVDEHAGFAQQDGFLFILDLELGGFTTQTCDEDSHLLDVFTKVRPDRHGGLGKVFALKQLTDNLQRAEHQRVAFLFLDRLEHRRRDVRTSLHDFTIVIGDGDIGDVEMIITRLVGHGVGQVPVPLDIALGTADGNGLRGVEQMQRRILEYSIL